MNVYDFAILNPDCEARNFGSGSFLISGSDQSDVAQTPEEIRLVHAIEAVDTCKKLLRVYGPDAFSKASELGIKLP